VVTVNWSTDVTLQGVHMWNVDEQPNTDPNDLSHANDVCSLSGGVNGLSVVDSFLEGNRLNFEAQEANISGLSIERTWYTGAAGTAFQFHSFNGHTVDGQRVGVYSWDQRGRNPNDRIDSVDGNNVPVGSVPSLVNVVDSGVSVSAPPPGVLDPSQTWRIAHPLGSWRVEVNASEPSDGSPLLWGALATGGTIVFVLVVLSFRSRRRKTVAAGTPA
jgi:hypothetical protein